MKRETIAGLIAIGAIVAMAIFAGCVEKGAIFKSADTPLPSKELQSMLQNQGYELVNITTYHKRYSTGGGRIVPGYKGYPEYRHEPGLNYIENPNPVREYYLNGNGSVAHFIWLSCQLLGMEYKVYSKADEFRVIGVVYVEPYDIPFLCKIKWEPDDSPSLHLGVCYDCGSSLPSASIWIDHVMHRSFAESCSDPSDITEADAWVLVEKLELSGLQIYYHYCVSDSFLYPQLPRPYKPGPEQLFQLASKSKLESWNYYKMSPYFETYTLEIEYSSPVPLELYLLDPKGNQVDSAWINGDILGSSKTEELWIDSPMNGTYKLVVKQAQTDEIIRTHELSVIIR